MPMKKRISPGKKKPQPDVKQRFGSFEAFTVKEKGKKKQGAIIIRPRNKPVFHMNLKPSTIKKLGL